MSASTPPPTPGTGPVVDATTAPRPRPYREDPEIAARDRVAGRISHTDGARLARVDSVARDLAFADLPGDPPILPPIAQELIESARSVISTAVAEETPERAAAVARVSDAQTTTQVAESALAEATLSLRRARVAVPEEPIGGARATHWLVPLTIAPVLVYLEMELSAAPIRAALESTDARPVAFMIALALTLASEGLGLVLGGILRPSPRATRAALATLALLLVGCAAWSVVSLASSREQNNAYRESLKPDAQVSSQSGGGFSSLLDGARDSAATRGAGSGAGSGGGGTDEASEIEANLDFIVPVTLLAMLAGALLSMRVSLAREWRKRHGDVARTESAEAELRGRLDRARQAETASRQDLDASDLRLAALAETELGTVSGLLQRLVVEYERWCAQQRTTPRHLLLPEVPSAAAILIPLLSPDRVDSTQPFVRQTRQTAGPAPEPPTGTPPPGAPPADAAPAGGPSPPRSDAHGPADPGDTAGGYDSGADGPAPDAGDPFAAAEDPEGPPARPPGAPPGWSSTTNGHSETTEER